MKKTHIKEGNEVVYNDHAYRFLRYEAQGRVKLECASTGIRVSFPANILS